MPKDAVTHVPVSFPRCKVRLAIFVFSVGKIATESFIGDYTKWHRAQIAQVMLLLLMGA